MLAISVSQDSCVVERNGSSANTYKSTSVGMKKKVLY